MNNKKIKTIIGIFAICIVVVICLAFSNGSNKSSKKKMTPTNINTNNIKENEVLDDTNKNNDVNVSNNSDLNNNVTTESTPTNENIQRDQNPTPQPNVDIHTPTCPEGYQFVDMMCISIIDTILVCPDGTTDFSDENTPRDRYCVNTLEAIDKVDETCPSGYGSLAIISLGAPTTYKCLPLHEKIIGCPEGYTLDINVCRREINPN